MAEDKAAKGGSAGAGTLSKVREEARHNPATVRLKEELEDYVEARLALMLQGVGHGLGEGARKLSEARAAGLTSTASHAKDALLDKAKGVKGKTRDVSEKAKDVTGKGHGKEPEGGTGRGLTIIEDIDVGVPVREAYGQWTQFQDFERFAKGVEGVEQEDDTTTQWHVKIAKASRHWRENITVAVSDRHRPARYAAPTTTYPFGFGLRTTMGGWGREPGMLMRTRVVSTVSVRGRSCRARGASPNHASCPHPPSEPAAATRTMSASWRIPACARCRAASSIWSSGRAQTPFRTRTVSAFPRRTGESRSGSVEVARRRPASASAMPATVPKPAPRS